MGLDMYLMAKKTMPRAAAIVLHKAAPDEFAKWNNPWLKTASQKVKAVAEAAYWRKANAVHGWFVREVQGGTDDCGTYLVTAQQLEELRDACKAALAGGAKRNTTSYPCRGSFSARPMTRPGTPSAWSTPSSNSTES